MIIKPGKRGCVLGGRFVLGEGVRKKNGNNHQYRQWKMTVVYNDTDNNNNITIMTKIIVGRIVVTVIKFHTKNCICTSMYIHIYISVCKFTKGFAPVGSWSANAEGSIPQPWTGSKL